MVEVSALQRTGIEDLLEQITLVAEVEELTRPVEGEARGVVLEANLEAGRGPVATLIVQQGTLRVGDPVVAGAAWGKVKALVDDVGDPSKRRSPRRRCRSLGSLSPLTPETRCAVRRTWPVPAHSAKPAAQRFRLSGTARCIRRDGGQARRPLRADPARRDGDAEYRAQGRRPRFARSGHREPQTLERDDVNLSFVLRGIGGITENDVQLAAASSATIIGFNVRPDKRAGETGRELRCRGANYEIIYKLLEDIEAAMLGLLSPSTKKWSPAKPKCARSSGSRESGQSLGAWCEKERSREGPRFASCARARCIGRAPSTRSVVSKMTPERCRRASSAALACRTSRTCTPVTSSKRTRSARSQGRDRTVKRRTATYPRSLRVNQVLRQVLAEELERLADADERFRMVTVTSVDTASDMRTTTVYLASLSEDAAEALEERRPHLQRFISAQVSLKRTPRLTFKADPAIVAGNRVEESSAGMTRWPSQIRRAGSTPTSGEPPGRCLGELHRTGGDR